MYEMYSIRGHHKNFIAYNSLNLPFSIEIMTGVKVEHEKNTIHTSIGGHLHG